MRTFLLVTVVALGATLWACKSNSNNPVSSNNTPAAPNYYPLGIGDAWNYAGYYTDQTGAKIPGTDQSETDTVTGTVVIGGQSVFEVTDMFKSSNFSSKGTGYYSFDQTGNLQTFVDTVLADTALTTGHDTIPAGHGYWQAVAWFGDTGTTKHNFPQQPTFLLLNLGNVYDTAYGTQTQTQMFAGDSTVTVGAGTFAAHVYRDSILDTYNSAQIGAVNGTIVQNSFYAKNVGGILVTSNSVFTGGLQASSRFYKQLVSYHIVD
jgi:hypothetical protein